MTGGFHCRGIYERQWEAKHISCQDDGGDLIAGTNGVEKVSLFNKEINKRRKHAESQEADDKDEVEDHSLEEYMDGDGLMDPTKDECGHDDDDEGED